MSRGRFALAGVTMLAYVVSQANLGRLVGSLEPNILALQLSFSGQAFWAVASAWGPEGVRQYLDHFPYDFVHPFVYGGMGLVWVRDTPLFAGWSAGVRRYWAWSLPVAGVCDLVENVLHIVLLSSVPGSGHHLALVAGLAASCKWTLAVRFAPALAGMTVRQLKRHAVG